MKFEDLLMQPSEGKQKIIDLEQEVENLEAELDGEMKLNMVLQCATEGSIHSCTCLSSIIPMKVQVLLAELAKVEEEVTWLERKVDGVKSSLHQERKQTKEWKSELEKELPMEWKKHRRQKKTFDRQEKKIQLKDYKVVKERRASLDIRSMSSLMSNGDYAENESSSERSKTYSSLDTEINIEMPNKLSEELIRCLIGIYLKLNRASSDTNISTTNQKHSLSCINSKGFISKSSFSFTIPSSSFSDNTSNIDPYGILPDLDVTIRDVGPYKNFIQITRSSLDTSRVSECFSAMGNLRILMHKLSDVDLTFLTYKQKLAFWINIYNSCIMHAFLQHGLPSSHDKLLALMNKAAMNVGGIVLNALAIEHFILRHPSNSVQGPTDEKEMLLRHAYGLGYPEPNVTFALCRGSWSSPALRIYTADEVVDELGRARVEYLEACVGVTSKKKIVVPKLLQWHMRDFADDIESLLEWIYSQLPRSGYQKRMIMECLNVETKSHHAKMIEIQPYVSEFRYMLPLSAT